MKGEILFLAHRIPFPADRGDKIRSHHVLKALAQLAPVHVGCFAETAHDRAQEGELAAIGATYCMPQRTKPLPLAGIEAVAKGLPVSFTAFHHAKLARYVARTLRERAVRTIYVFSGQMAQYVPPAWDGRLVVDLVDVDSAKFEQYANDGGGPMGWINAREGRLLRRHEARLARVADRTLLVSDEEAALLRSRLPEGTWARIEALGNGIDAAAFDPAHWPAQAELAAAPGPHLVITGQMDYQPNVEAALRVARDILPAIRETHPQARFHAVGRAPAPALRAIDGEGGVRVWGEVSAVQPFLAAADLVVAPLMLARGIQNKILEAMAMARPVILSPQAATGIGATEGAHWRVAESDADFVRAAIELLADRERAAAMGTAARRFVVERRSWPAMLERLPEIVGRAGGQRHAA